MPLDPKQFSEVLRHGASVIARNYRAVELEPCCCPVCRECRRIKGDRTLCDMQGPYSGYVEVKREEATKS